MGVPRPVKRSTAAALFGLALAAILLRLSPLFRAPYWGSDFGEYYALTKALVAQGALPTSYGGWGVTYPYFPGLFVLDGAFALGGLPVDAAIVFPVPIVAGLSVLPLFLITVRVTGDDLAGLSAAAFLAVVMLHVYATSHAIPATLGDVLLLGALLMYLGMRHTPRLFLPALLTALAILVTHHLATYVLVLAVVGSLLVRGVLESGITLRRVRYELVFLATVILATLVYWLTYGHKLWDLILANSPFSTGALVTGALLGLVIVALVILGRRYISWRFQPKTRSVRSVAVASTLAIAASFSLVAFAVLASIPGTTIRLSPLHLVVFAPTIAFVSVSAAGRRVMDFSREGGDVTAWFAVLVLSVIVGASLIPTVLIPYRHLEYLVIPVAVMVGAGIRWLSLGRNTPVSQLAAVGLVGILVASSATISVPPPVAMAGFNEATGRPSASAVLWVREHAGGLVGGDHRLSSILFGFAGVDATWDRGNRFWHEENLTRAIDLMRAVPVRDRVLRVEWVVLDQTMRAGLQTSPFEPALPLLPSEYGKFAGAPFHKVFDSGSAQVYFLNWGLA